MKAFVLVLVSVAILLVLLQQFTGLDKVLVILAGINVIYLPFIVLLPFLIVFVYAVRWRMLLRSVGIDVGVPDVLKYSLVGIALNNVTPMVRFGGEPVKGYMVAKDLEVSKKKVFASITIDTLITVITMLSVVYFAILGIPMTSIMDFKVLWAVLFLMLLPLTLGIYVLYDERALKSVVRGAGRLAGKFSRGSGRDLEAEAVEFRGHLASSLSRAGTIVKAFLLGFIERFVEIVCLYVIFVSLGADVSLYTCLVAIGAGFLGGMIPLFPGGLVTYESFTILILNLLGLSPAVAATGILLWRMVSYWMFTFIGLGLACLKGARMGIRSCVPDNEEKSDEEEEKPSTDYGPEAEIR